MRAIQINYADEQAKLYGKQLNSYAFVTLRSVGEQPGQSSPRYLASWKTLPEGAIIPAWKFSVRGVFPELYVTNYTSYSPAVLYDSIPIYGFRYTNNIPFPSAEAAAKGGPYPWLPYIAFNHLGQLTQDGVSLSDYDEYIPVARGGVLYAADQNRVATAQPPSMIENPTGNGTNAFTVVHIDKLTGRARLEKQELLP